MKRLFSALLVFVALLSATGAWAQNGNYLVRPGDILSIEVLEDPSLNRDVLVLPDGRFSFPFAGQVLAGGRTLSQVERALASSISENFAIPPNVFVSISTLQPDPPIQPQAAPTIEVYFLGEVNNPGKRVLPADTTFLQALAENGKLTNFAADKRIQLRRTDPHSKRQQVFLINYRAISKGAALNYDVPLEDGDVILVPERRLFE